MPKTIVNSWEPCHDELGKLSQSTEASNFLLQLSEMEVLGRQNRSVQQKIKKALFPSLKTLDGFDFTALPSLNQKQVSGLAKCEYVERHENIIALGNSRTGKTHLAISLGIVACQKGISQQPPLLSMN